MAERHERPDAAPVSVVIADGAATTRVGVRAALEAGGMVVCAEAVTAEEAVRAVVAHGPDVCLLEILLPGDGIVAVERITAAAPGTAIIVLTASAGEQHLLAALAAGARGYLLKDTNPDRLPAAINGVLRGEAAIPRTLVPHLVGELARRARVRSASGDRGQLTEREHQVLSALAEDRTTRQVAESLGIAEATVRRHAAAAAAKLGAATRDEAVQRFRGGHGPPKTE